MTHIPEELLEQVERGNVALFLGERILCDTQGNIAIDQWSAELARRCGIADPTRYAFPDLAQAYEDISGRHALIQFVRDRIEALGDEPEPLHRLLSAYGQVPDLTTPLFSPVLVTTSPDLRLERAFREAQRPLDTIVGATDVAFEEERRAQLYKLRGSIDQIESLVLTRDDIETFFEERRSISLVLQAYLARKTFLFLGYDMSDRYFQRLYWKVTTTLDVYARRSYALFPEPPSTMVASWCKRRGITMLQEEETAFVAALNQEIQARTRQTLNSHPYPPPPDQAALVLPEHPYKLLDYYEASDTALFFGRQQETSMLSSLIHIHRLVLLHGASGVGKTSLLLAGVVPRLERADPSYTAIYVRVLDDPVQVIRRALQRRLNMTFDGSLVDIVHAATTVLGHSLIIILDQFEEFFIRLGPQLRAAFIDELGALYDARDIPAKLVISLREDCLAAMSEIEQRIPDIFRTRLRLLPFSREQAQQAITAPAERMGISYDPDLLDRLLIDLMGKRLADHAQSGEMHLGSTIMPPQLQLVCSALYQALGADERMITLALYERLGGARGILQQYLDDELERFHPAERGLAHRVLEELITSQNTRAVKRDHDLAVALNVELEILAPVLQKLLHARLLRTLESENGATSYELAHEYLIREIELGSDTQRRKQIEELIQQEVENWKRLGTLIGRDRLMLVNEVREELRLNPETQELLMRSALHWGYEVPYWLSRLRDPDRRVVVLTEVNGNGLPAVLLRAEALLAAVESQPDTGPQLAEVLIMWLSDKDWRVRASAANTLKRLGVINTDIATLVASALVGRLNDVYWEVRHNVVVALEAVGAMDDKIAVRVRDPLIERLNDEDRLVRASAVSALAEMGSIYPIVLTPQLVTALTDRLDDDDALVRASAAVALEQIVTVSVGISRSVAEMLLERIDTPSRQLNESIVLAMGGVGMAIGTRQANHVLPQMIAALAMLLSHDDQEIRSNAAVALGQIGASKRELAVQVIADLIKQLTDEESVVRANVAAALGQVSTVSADIAQQVVATLLTGISSPDRHMREWAVIALAHVGEINIATIPQIVDTLVARLSDKAWQVRARAAIALGRVMTTGNREEVVFMPALATIVLASEALLERLNDTVEIVGTSATTSLGEMATLLGFALSSSSDAPERVPAADPNNPGEQQLNDLLQRIVATLIGRLTSHNRDIRASTALVLGTLALANPTLAPPITAALVEQLTDPESYVRFRAAGILGQIYARQAQQPGATDDFLFHKLTDPANPQERPVAARALFFGALHTPERCHAIRARLESLASNKQQTPRIWASIALQMVDLADLAHAALRNPLQRDAVQARLERFKMAEFFDSDITWAAGKALEWLEAKLVQRSVIRSPHANRE